MKRILLTAAILTAATMSYAQPRYECHRATGPILIDGILSEASWQTAPESGQFKDIRGEQWPEQPTMQTTFKMLYDDTYLYIGGIIRETDIRGSLTEHDSIIYHDNDFEVFIDPYDEGRFYYELEFNALGTVMDLLMTKPYREDGNYLMNWDCTGLQIKTSYDGTINDSSDTDKAWYIEIAIPLISLDRRSKKLSEQKVWRMNFSRVEWLKKGGPEENWVWAPTGIVDIHIPAKWGYVDFVY